MKVLRSGWLGPLVIVALAAGACSPKKTAIRVLGKALAEGSSVYASDPDPELVREALPFGLKTIEGLLASDPGNRDLALAACSGFAQYGYAFVLGDRDRLVDTDLEAAEVARNRAVALLLRGRDHCLSAWPPEARADLQRNPAAAAAGLGTKDAALLYWTGATWGGALSAGRDRPGLLGDLPVIRALFARLLTVAPEFDHGAGHEAMIALEALPAMMGGSLDRAEDHYRRALELSRGQRASTFVAYAESVAVSRQDRAAFLAALERALAIDVDTTPNTRLANLVSQARARRLLERVDDYFLEPLDELDEPPAEEQPAESFP